jgi:hypothetical protein
MKKSELKQIIKPLVKECIYETLVEGGLLSGIITEVVRGINSGNKTLVTEQADREQETRAVAQKEANLEAERQKQKLHETKRKMLEAIGQDSYNGVNLFEGTDPISKAGQEGAPAAPDSPLSHVSPGDAGVDLGNFSGISKKWGSLLK